MSHAPIPTCPSSAICLALSPPSTTLRWSVSIQEEAALVPPGSDGLVFLPYLQGERTPHLDAYARGGWIGLTAGHAIGEPTALFPRKDTAPAKT